LFLLTFLAALTFAVSGARAAPPGRFVEGALCVHSGWHYTRHRVHGQPPEYVLWRHGYWRTWDVPDTLAGGSGEGGWTATSDPRYGGGMSFTLGTWNEAAGYSHGRVPRASSTAGIAGQPPLVQILAVYLIVRARGHWGDWPNTSRACGLR
jgi:hypothetical protein